jgi:hypothetical protein
MEETSLDDFLGATGPAAEQDADGTTSASSAETEPAPAAMPDEVESGGDGDGPVAPPTVTAAWSPDVVRCGDCGDPLEWGWGVETGLVCTECLDW